MLIYNAFMQGLLKIIINKNLFDKVTSFCLHFITQPDFNCEQVEQQTSQPELKRVSVVRFSETSPLVLAVSYGFIDFLLQFVAFNDYSVYDICIPDMDFSVLIICEMIYVQFRRKLGAVRIKKF